MNIYKERVTTSDEYNPFASQAQRAMRTSGSLRERKLYIAEAPGAGREEKVENRCDAGTFGV